MAYYLSTITEWFGERMYFTFKYIAHLTYGSCEIHRICCRAEGAHSQHMSSKFAQSLRRSKQLVADSRIIFSRQLFSTREVLKNVLDVKCISSSDPILVTNIRLSIEGLSVVNKVYAHLQVLRSTTVDMRNKDHVRELERFWSNMQNNKDESNSGSGGKNCPGEDNLRFEETKKPLALIGDHWGDVGFQGKNPCTDFRGMGLLSLRQLTYFSQFRQANALHVLSESKHHRRYFPFAATGINITSFVMDLFAETRLHHTLFKRIDILSLYMNSGSSSSSSSNSSSTPLFIGQSGRNNAFEDDAAAPLGDEEKYIIACTEVIHDLYCILYEEFCGLWVEKDPRDVMAFPLIFQEFKATVRGRYFPI